MSSSNEKKTGQPPQMAPEPYSFLPAPKSVPLDAPNPPSAGWWNDPLSSDEIAQRYHDGNRWTEYVCIRTPQRWTDVFPDHVNLEVDPETLGIPRPPAVLPEPPPDPPMAGWWADPIERKLKQARYFDGSHWTDLIGPTKSDGLRVVVRRRDPKEVIREERAAQAAAKHADDAPTKRRWPWSR